MVPADDGEFGADSIYVLIGVAFRWFPSSGSSHNTGQTEAGNNEDCDHDGGSKVEFVGRFSPSV